MKRSRKTKEQVLAEERMVMGDISSAIHYINFQTAQEIKDFTNSYRVKRGDEPLTLAQIKKGIRLFAEEGMIRKRKDKYAYVN
jgi:hypothetical protein